MDIGGLLAIVFAFAIVTASPGPAILALATCAMASGRQTALRFGLGLATGLSLWGIVAATGLGVVLLASELILLALKLAGAAYLLWLAFSAFRAASDTQDQVPKLQFSFVSGLVFNCLNPKAVVAWMAALSMGLSPDAGIGSLLVATLCCALAAIVINLTIAVGFSMPGMMSFYGRFKRRIQLVSSGLFALAGGALIRSAVKQ